MKHKIHYNLMCLLAASGTMLGFNSCLDIEEEFGAKIDLKTMIQTKVEPMNGDYYSAWYQLNISVDQLALIEVEEAGYEYPVGARRWQVPMVQSLDGSLLTEIRIDSLRYNQEYTFFPYVLAHQVGVENNKIRYAGEGSAPFTLDSYSFLKLTSFTAEAKGDSIMAEVSFNDLGYQRNAKRKIRHGIFVSTNPDFTQNLRHVRDVDMENNVDDEDYYFYEFDFSTLYRGYQPEGQPNTARAVFRNLCADRKYYCRAYTFLYDEEQWFTGPDGIFTFTEPIELHTEPNHETDCYVDLGLSVLWCNHNYGASSPAEDGTKALNSINSAPTYFYNTNTTGHWDNVFADVDLIAWEWGQGWRLPSVTEAQELIDRCQWKEDVKDGHPGMSVTGPNGNSIFIPTQEYSTSTLWIGEGETGHLGDPILEITPSYQSIGTEAAYPTPSYYLRAVRNK